MSSDGHGQNRVGVRGGSLPGELINQRSLILVGLLFAASVVPVLSVEIPAMIDYVNQLARMHLLVDAAARRPNPAYQIDWRLYPNLAVDIIVPVQFSLRKGLSNQPINVV